MTFKTLGSRVMNYGRRWAVEQYSQRFTAWLKHGNIAKEMIAKHTYTTY